MSTDFAEAAGAVEQVAAGAAKAARKVASDPIGSARKQAKGIGRQGTRAARRINRRFSARLRALAPAKLDVFGIVLDGRFPEKAAVKGLHLVQARARRNDGMGVIAKRTLRVLHISFGTIARVATRFEQASGSTAAHSAAAKQAVRRSGSRRRSTRQAA